MLLVSRCVLHRLRFLAVGLAIGAVPVRAARAAEEPGAAPPKLAVVIVVDQFRADFLPRFRPYFVASGFNLLLRNGADFTACHFRHAVTKTAPGHATILSGTFPEIHGIIGNDWRDPATGRTIVSVEDSASPLVGAAAAETDAAREADAAVTGRSPRQFLASTVGDQLKLRYGDRTRVFTISNKDRSAILLGGKLADAAFWESDGRIVTSRYYRSALPDWVEAFNANAPVAACFGKTWERLIDAAAYDAVQGPDDAPGESTEHGLSRTLPKRIDGGRDAVSPEFLEAFDNSPFSAELVAAFAKEIVRHEKLGRRDAPDLLGLSFSQIDTIGHSYGPDSHEMMDSVLRLDRVLADLFAFLDAEIGLSRCVIVLTADHGAAPLPERLHALRDGAIPSARVRGADLDAAVAQALDAEFGAPAGSAKWLIRDNAGYHFSAKTLAAKRVKIERATTIAKAALLRQPAVAAVFTRDEILATSDEGDSVPAMVRRAFYPPRSPDIFFILRPYFIEKSDPGTTHGAPWDYDTHVPLLWYGAGVPRGEFHERVGVEDLAMTLAGLLHVPPPPEARGRRLF